jgi:hypothetical protein
VVSVDEHGDLGFVRFRIPFQTGNPLFDRTAKTGADLKAFIGCAIGNHGELLDVNLLRPK